MASSDRPTKPLSLHIVEQSGFQAMQAASLSPSSKRQRSVTPPEPSDTGITVESSGKPAAIPAVCPTMKADGKLGEVGAAVRDAWLQGVLTWAEWQRVLHSILSVPGIWTADDFGTLQHAADLFDVLKDFIGGAPQVDWAHVRPLLQLPVLRGFEFVDEAILRAESSLDDQGRVGFLRHPSKAISLLGQAVGIERDFDEEDDVDERCARCSGSAPGPYATCVVVAVPAATVAHMASRSTPKKRRAVAPESPVPQPEQAHGHRRVLPDDDEAYDASEERVWLYQGACMCCAWNGKESSCSFHPAYVAPKVPVSAPTTPNILNDAARRDAFLGRLARFGIGRDQGEEIVDEGLSKRAVVVEEVKVLRAADRRAKKAKAVLLKGKKKGGDEEAPDAADAADVA
jgi:hypothetical protein